jgi:hypothetical protein
MKVSHLDNAGDHGLERLLDEAEGADAEQDVLGPILWITFGRNLRSKLNLDHFLFYLFF